MTELIKLSSLLSAGASQAEGERLKESMDAGDDYRALSKEAVAVLGMQQVRRIRVQYWSDDEIDRRDFTKEKDINDERQKKLVDDLLKRLGAQNLLAAEANIDTLTTEFFFRSASRLYGRG